MTILNAIGGIDALKPNTYGQDIKLRWLSDLDGLIKKQIIDVHEGGENFPFDMYNDDTPLDTQLLVPHPYDDIHIKWLEASIDYANGEYGKYNNSITMYNAAYSAFEKYYNRTHMPIGVKFKYF